MPRILLVECMQEISSFNPVPSEYENFAVRRGSALLAQRGRNTAMGGAVGEFGERADVQVVPAYSARAGSAGLLSRTGWARLSDEILTAIGEHASAIDGVYFSMHGAMGADGELDPEGYLLAGMRRLVGDKIPVVISLDLHGILTERMLRHIDGLAVYHTYPHVDFADTGARAARLLMEIIDRRLTPLITRVVIPALVRGDELITKSGCYGEVIREAQRLERERRALAAGVMIGNPFTDVPELCSQAVVVVERHADLASAEAARLAEGFWAQRFRMQAKLIALDRAIAQARHIRGPVIFTDAADATSSGATGDSNAILAGLLAAKYGGRVLLPIVDPPAVAAAFRVGVGATLRVALGGALDRRFTPVELTVTVEMLSDGHATLETSGSALEAGPTAVLVGDNFTIVAMTRSVSLFDRAMFLAHGRDPKAYDLIVVKSPHCEYHMYDQWAEVDFNIDAPGATSANLQSLGHRICRRPIFPLDADVPFTPRPQVFARGRREGGAVTPP
ncbi:MAG TPA: M81 family metallopeptidase [bacterium]|nr:M81 family metallopeptidase [bacterium]